MKKPSCLNRWAAVLSLTSALLGGTLSVISAPDRTDTLRERYIAGLTLISETQTATERMGQTLNIIEDSTNQQTQRVTYMEDILLSVQQATNSYQTTLDNLSTNTASLLTNKKHIEIRFSTLDRALTDDRAILKQTTEAVNALVESADRSGSYVERRIADQAVADLKSYAVWLRTTADQLAQMRQRMGLENTLFSGLQPRLTNANDDIKAIIKERQVINTRVAQQRKAIEELHAMLNKDRANLGERFDAFGAAVENFRITQIDVLRRWLLDGPPSGDLPSLTIDDIIESGLPAAMMPRAFPSNTMLGSSAGSGSNLDMGSTFGSSRLGAKGMGAEDQTQISAEFTQLNKRVRWCMSMLQRLLSFSEQSIREANLWINDAATWRSSLTDTTRSIADQRGRLTTLQMEQDIVTSTIELISKQSKDSNTEVAKTASYITSQTAKLQQITDELKRLAAD